jgi:2-methylisocitrate lyase-like PEP mutase family enzyme
MVANILTDAAYTVPAVPPASTGVAWLRASVVRFSEGEAHSRRRAIVEAELARVDIDVLRKPGDAVAKLAEALGLPRQVVPDVWAVARCYQPHLPAGPDADAAVARLVAASGGNWDEVTANRIGLLVQAVVATSAMIAGQDPPAPATRRVAPDGAIVEVPLAGIPFGLGRHACPGRAHAEAMVAGAFHQMHQRQSALFLPNAWDFASAAALVEAGFSAIGTTSLGVAASNGRQDATGATRLETIRLARQLAGLPAAITVDIEAGFGDAAGLAKELADIGVCGVNLEDGRSGALADAGEQAQLIACVKQAAPHVFLNARIDTYWLGRDHDATIGRARRYVDAGADGVFVPGLTDPQQICDVARAAGAPLNVLVHPRLSVAELADLGVRRVSTGSLLFRSALGASVKAALAAREGQGIDAGMSYQDVQELIGRVTG